MARAAALLLDAPGVGGVEERIAAGEPGMPVLHVRFDPEASSVTLVAAAARHGLELDPANPLPVATTVLAAGRDAVGFVRWAMA